MCQNSFFFNFPFFHWFKLDLVKMAKLACDLLCQRMRQHFDSVCGACSSTLLAQAEHTLANCQRRRRTRQQYRVKMSFCKRTCACGSTMLAYAVYAVATCQRRRHIRQQIASVCAAYGSTLLAQTAHAVEKPCKNLFHCWLELVSVDGACVSTLLEYEAHAVANCQHRQRRRQQFASICGSNLLAQTSHTVAICQRTRRIQQQNRVKLCVLLAQTAHTVANCQRMRHMRQHFASVDSAYGSNLLAQTAQAVAKTKWPVSHPSVKNVKILFQSSALTLPYREKEEICRRMPATFLFDPIPAKAKKLGLLSSINFLCVGPTYA